MTAAAAALAGFLLLALARATALRVLWRLPGARGEDWFFDARIMDKAARARLLRRYRGRLLGAALVVEALALADLVLFPTASHLLRVQVPLTLLHAVARWLVLRAFLLRARDLAPPAAQRLVLSLKPRRLADYSSPGFELANAAVVAAALVGIARTAWPADALPAAFLVHVQLGGLLWKHALLRRPVPLPADRSEDYLRLAEDALRFGARGIDRIRGLCSGVLLIVAARGAWWRHWSPRADALALLVLAGGFAAFLAAGVRHARRGRALIERSRELPAAARRTRLPDPENLRLGGLVYCNAGNPAVVVDGGRLRFAVNVANRATYVYAAYWLGLALLLARWGAAAQAPPRHAVRPPAPQARRLEMEDSSGPRSRDDRRMRRLLADVAEGRTAAVTAALDADPALIDAEGPHPYWGGRPRPLHVAVEWIQPALVELLLARGADPEGGGGRGYGGWTPLQLAVARGHLRGDLACAGLLIARGARVDAFAAAGLGDAERLRRVLDDDPAAASRRGPNGGTPLHWARTPAVAELLVERGADVRARDENGNEPARCAATHRDPQRAVARWLLSRSGAAPDAHLAAAMGDLDALRRLVEADAALIGRQTWAMDALGFYGGGTPLHIAALHGQTAAARMLLAAGAAVDAPDLSGATPLHYTAARGELAMAALLVDAGADLGARDAGHDATPAGWAQFQRWPALVELLRARGAVL